MSPDAKREQAQDDGSGQQETDQERLDGLLEEATTEDFSASEELFIPEVNSYKPKPVIQRPPDERRTSEDEGDDDDPGASHIDIIA